MSFLTITTLLALLALARADEITDESAWDKVKGVVERITTGAADACSNEYVSGPYIESVMCDGVVPREYTDRLNIEFGPGTLWCKGLACAYRLMGCAVPTYRIEVKIIRAEGEAEHCGKSVGIDEEHCAKLAKFIAKVPDMPQKKRRVDAREAKMHAALAVEAYAPHTPGLDGLFNELGFTADPERKRSLVEELQVCSPLIGLGLKLIEDQVNLPVNVSQHLGPCGTICNYAVCGMNLICGNLAARMLTKINGDRRNMGCSPLTCAQFDQAPPSQCEGVQCPEAEGYWNTQTCPPPKRIHNPSKAHKDDCCQRCDAPCDGVRCPPVNCPKPDYPLCVEYQIGKYDQFDCCEQCIDPCAQAKQACPEPPTSCGPNQFLGPSRPGDCCLSCQPKCVGVSCAGGPLKATDCPEGQLFKDRVENPQTCDQCCPKCVGKPNAQKDEPTDNANSLAASVASAIASAAAFI